MFAGPGSSQARRWYSAVGAMVGVALIAGGAAALLPRHASPAGQDMADPCGLVRCGVSLPAAVLSGSPSASGQDQPSRSPSQSPTPTPSALPSPDVTVAYTLSHPAHAGGPFRATVTLTNHGAAAVSAWTLQLALPGDTIDWVAFAGSQFQTWQMSGGILYLKAALASETIAPGRSQQIEIRGHGPRLRPSSCVFDAAVCQV